MNSYTAKGKPGNNGQAARPAAGMTCSCVVSTLLPILLTACILQYLGSAHLRSGKL